MRKKENCLLSSALMVLERVQQFLLSVVSFTRIVEVWSLMWGFKSLHNFLDLSIISYPLTTQGQMSAVGTIVSAGYGFICGAYMPISDFGSGLQKVLSYLPGTYGTLLIYRRKHSRTCICSSYSIYGIFWRTFLYDMLVSGYGKSRHYITTF